MEIKLFDRNPFTRPGKGNARKGIVVHWGAVAGLTAADWHDRFSKPTQRHAGYGYFVGPDGVVQAVPDTESTYHVGSYHYFPWILKRFGKDPNRQLIGMLLSSQGEYGEYDRATLLNGIDFLAQKCLEYGWNPVHDIFQHSQITGKGIGSPYDMKDTLPCPRYFVSNPVAWWDFVKSVEAQKVELEIERQDRES